jgi:hypothetical protein
MVMDGGRKVEDKEIMEEHMMERNIEHLSHSRKKPIQIFGLGSRTQRYRGQANGQRHFGGHVKAWVFIQ